MNLIIRGISKSYGNNKALSNFSATFEPGIYALLGPNGSGKSTLMNIITDNLKADSGEILYSDGGEPENILGMGVRFREKIGFMPQYPEMYPGFTIEQFMRYMAVLKDMGNGMQRRERREYINTKICQVLTAVELQDISNRKIGALSGGMKQRLALAQAVLSDPEILILDEPTAGLDPKQRISVRNYISQIALDKIVIIATHVVSDIEFIARSIIMLKRGTIIDNSPVTVLVSKIDGKVWDVPVPEADVAAFQHRFRVVNIARDDVSPQLVRLRVISDIRPTDNSSPISPTLEDYYLYTFNDISKQ